MNKNLKIRDHAVCDGGWMTSPAISVLHLELVLQ